MRKPRPPHNKAPHRSQSDQYLHAVRSFTLACRDLFEPQNAVTAYWNLAEETIKEAEGGRLMASVTLSNLILFAEMGADGNASVRSEVANAQELADERGITMAEPSSELLIKLEEATDNRYIFFSTIVKSLQLAQQLDAINVRSISGQN
jgi:hypothetical protein